MASHPIIAAGDNRAYMEYALSLARKVTPLPTNFCVGAVVVNESSNEIIATGYTNERPGNTHAEEVAFSKLLEGAMSRKTVSSETKPRSRLSLYTTMEPCNKRASGKEACVDRILEWNRVHHPGQPGLIAKVFVGVSEPRKFFAENDGRGRLTERQIEYIQVPGLEDEIVTVATAGHAKAAS